MQRSIVLELDKLASFEKEGDLTYASSWNKDKLESRGGREAWLAHHLLVLHRFFVMVEKHWDERYKAKYRLKNIEQALMLVGEHVFGLDVRWIPDLMAAEIQAKTLDNDWALEGLKQFARHHLATQGEAKGFAVKHIVEWCEEEVDYKDCPVLINSRKLGRYMASNAVTILQNTGIKFHEKRMNLAVYKVDGKYVER